MAYTVSDLICVIIPVPNKTDLIFFIIVSPIDQNHRPYTL